MEKKMKSKILFIIFASILLIRIISATDIAYVIKDGEPILPKGLFDMLKNQEGL